MSYDEALGSTLIARTVREKIVLVGVTIPPARDDETEADLDELVQLVDTAGADVVARVEQRRERPDPAYFVGKGKAEELRDLCLAVDADTVVFDNELSPAQQYNLEKLLGRTAIDRTAVILDIFAQNAHTLEGRAQVELALLRYRASGPARAPARRSSRRTAAGSPGASPGSSRSCASSAATGSCSAGVGRAAGCTTCRSSATPTRASPRC
jgi:GTP-binding protein HflX